MPKFELKQEHLQLLRAMHLRWKDDDWGTPAIDSKRPFGNADIYTDIADILGIKPGHGQELTEDQARYFWITYRETEKALQIVLSRAGICEAKPGVYVTKDGKQWDYRGPSKEQPDLESSLLLTHFVPAIPKGSAWRELNYFCRITGTNDYVHNQDLTCLFTEEQVRLLEDFGDLRKLTAPLPMRKNEAVMLTSTGDVFKARKEYPFSDPNIVSLGKIETYKEK